jgi:hypothetical protein
VLAFLKPEFLTGEHVTSSAFATLISEGLVKRPSTKSFVKTTERYDFGAFGFQTTMRHLSF